MALSRKGAPQTFAKGTLVGGLLGGLCAPGADLPTERTPQAPCGKGLGVMGVEGGETTQVPA